MADRMQISKTGVSVVEDYLRSVSRVIKVFNLEEHQKYQKADIDIAVITLNDGVVGFETIEIKTDTYKTGNLYFETVSCIEKETPGCLMYSEADYLYYYFVQTTELYVMNMKMFREWVIKNRNSFVVKNTSTKLFGEAGRYTSEGLLVPLWKIRKNFKLFEGQVILLRDDDKQAVI